VDLEAKQINPMIPASSLELQKTIDVDEMGLQHHAIHFVALDHGHQAVEVSQHRIAFDSRSMVQWIVIDESNDFQGNIRPERRADRRQAGAISASVDDATPPLGAATERELSHQPDRRPRPCQQQQQEGGIDHEDCA
jgi:hypothetical protein